MGYDATVYIEKTKYSIQSVEELILLMGYKKTKFGYYCGEDFEYKYASGVSVRIGKKSLNQQYHIVFLRSQIWASFYDLQKMNNTLRMLRKYCNAYFISDNGKNRYFVEGEKLDGVESGCYLAITRLENGFSDLKHSLQKYPEDEENEKFVLEYGIPSPSVFNSNVYSAFLCALIEEYFRTTYIALLRFSDRKEKVISNAKLSIYDLLYINAGECSFEEAYARILSFQNMDKIVKNFRELDSRLDVGTPLKKPYHRRKRTLYEQLHEIFERRHRMIHHVNMDLDYSKSALSKDIRDTEVAIKRVYTYLCERYGWTPQI